MIQEAGFTKHCMCLFLDFQPPGLQEINTYCLWCCHSSLS